MSPVQKTSLERFVVSFKSPKLKRHIVLGEVQAISGESANDYVRELLIKNGVDKADLLPPKNYFEIKLRDGTIVDIHPLARLEDWIACVSQYMKGGSILDLEHSDYYFIAATLDLPRRPRT